MRADPHRPPLPDAAPVRLDRSYALAELPTPALVLDLDRLDENLRRMAAHLGERGVALRPHTKTHKCPLLGHRQMEAGAIGLCCAKVSEAEVMAASGLDAILITSPVVTRDKVERVVELARHAPRAAIVLDSEPGARLLSAAAQAAGVEVAVLIDLDPGTHRTGVAPGEPARNFARLVAGLPGLRLWGLQAYAGHLMHVKGFAERRLRSLETWQSALETRQAIERDGIALPVLTGGGTGTWDIDSEVGGVTDLQVGSYVFMDAEYRAIGGPAGDLFEPFETALFVLATAISQPVPHLITIDAGFKAFSSNSVCPELMDAAGVRYHWGGDEHGILELGELAATERAVGLGEKLRLRVPHCDPTVNLYDFYYALRGGRVEELWPIAARGRSQ